ncbi:MAG: SRPBCC family protein [Ktedonobacteraceae bacterium]|nr:SRPBCC family protein [Ktedonobacteraceae bacterium]
MYITVSIAIACPVASVFEFVSDYTRDPEWRSGVIEMSQTPPEGSRVGTQTLEVARFFGRKMTTPAEITKYEPGRKTNFAGLMAQKIPVSGSRTVEAINGQALFTYQANVEVHGLLKLLSPLMIPILRRRFLSDLRRLKALLETASRER